MPTMRSYPPSTAAIIDGEGITVVAIRYTGVSNVMVFPRMSVTVNPGPGDAVPVPAGTVPADTVSRVEQAPRASARTPSPPAKRDRRGGWGYVGLRRDKGTPFTGYKVGKACLSQPEFILANKNMTLFKSDSP